jgi:hypothetical protein
VADFSHPPEFSSCLDNSAAKHKLLVKPRNRKMRRLSSVTRLPTPHRMYRQGGSYSPPPALGHMLPLNTPIVSWTPLQELELLAFSA